jgi:hypothetical protein
MIRPARSGMQKENKQRQTSEVFETSEVYIGCLMGFEPTTSSSTEEM